MMTKSIRVAAVTAISILIAATGTPSVAQWGNGYGSAPWANWNRTGPWWGAYNTRPNWETMPWNRSNGPWGGNPMTSTWGNGWNNAWYNTMGNGWNRSGPWNNVPFMGNLGPTGGRAPFGNLFPDPTDPKGTLERMWDESLDAPSRMGRMPGGWRAPSISVPNPVDVGDELGEAMYDAPGQVRNFNFR
ncbi:MAG: hypothetical protein ACPG4N_13350, partial [Gammaproteobacteria bacterium]